MGWIAVAALVVVVAAVLVWRASSRPGPVATATAEPAPPSEPESGWSALLRRTRDRFGDQLAGLLGRSDDGRWAALEETLLGADVGVRTSERLVAVARRASGSPREALASEMRALLSGPSGLVVPQDKRPFVILVAGVNGTGKTTTIGKLAARFRAQGLTVVLGAADTFRAAAIDQLGIWAERAGAEFVRQAPGADPGAVAYDTVAAAVARGLDVALIDTAGRLQTARPLMEELSKVRRAIAKALPGAPHETLLVLDGTVGQNAVSQATQFHEAAPLTGVVVTKLDGTARGGALLAVAAETRLPIRLVGVGERLEDLRDFDGSAFVEAILATSEPGSAVSPAKG
jgi:fused signal recognition particle receptor